MERAPTGIANFNTFPDLFRGTVEYVTRLFRSRSSSPRIEPAIVPVEAVIPGIAGYNNLPQLEGRNYDNLMQLTETAYSSWCRRRPTDQLAARHSDVSEIYVIMDLVSEAENVYRDSGIGNRWQKNQFRTLATTEMLQLAIRAGVLPGSLEIRKWGKDKDQVSLHYLQNKRTTTDQELMIIPETSFVRRRDYGSRVPVLSSNSGQDYRLLDKAYETRYGVGFNEVMQSWQKQRGY